MKDEKTTVVARILDREGKLLLKLKDDIHPLGNSHRVVLRLSRELVLERGDVIELIWERV